MQYMMIRNAYLASNKTSSHVLIMRLPTNLCMSLTISKKEHLAGRSTLQYGTSNSRGGSRKTLGERW